MKGKTIEKSTNTSPSKSNMRFFPTQLMGEFDIDAQGPESNFQKVMNIPKETPIKEYRHLVHSLCDSYNYQKAILKKFVDIELPKGISKENKKKQVFKNYQQIVKFAHLKKQKEHFSRRKFYQTQTNFKQSKIKNLAEIVEDKKNQLLMEESPAMIELQKVKCILKDNKKREDLFLQALLIERLQQIQNQKEIDQSDKKSSISPTKTQIKIHRHKRIKTQQCQLPQKLKGINPRHIRVINNCKTQSDFERQKYVQNQRKLRFYNYAYRIQKNQKKAKKEQNSLVIKSLLEFNDTIGLDGNQKSNSYINRIYKVFLKYSNNEDENPENLYNYIPKENLNQFLKDYKIEVKERPQIIKFMKEHENLTQFQFMELLYMIGNINNEQVFDLKNFMQECIYSNKKVEEPYPWNKIPKIKQAYQKLLKIFKFNEITEYIFKSRKSEKSSVLNQLIDFNELIQILWELEIFPMNVNKKIARFMFLYGSSQPYGLNLPDFQNVLLAIGLMRKETRLQKKIRWVLQHLSHYSQKQK